MGKPTRKGMKKQKQQNSSAEKSRKQLVSMVDIHGHSIPYTGSKEVGGGVFGRLIKKKNQ